MGEYFSLSFSMYGLAIVISMLVAILIKGIVLSLSVIRKPPVVAPEPVRSTDPDAEDDIAVIAAAVCAVMTGHRIVHIEPTDRGLGWKAAGRTIHHTSHNIPRPRH